jgi:hypothetical protein
MQLPVAHRTWEKCNLPDGIAANGRISPETAPLKLPQSHGASERNRAREVKRNVTTNPAIWGETHFDLTPPTTISRISTCSRPKETGRSGSVSSTISCCGWGLRLGSSETGQIGELDETPGLSAGAWQMRPLSRHNVEAKSNRLGDAPSDQPALSVVGTRPPRHRRRPALGAADIRCTGAEAIRPRREPTRRPNPDRRRIARLRAAQRRHLLSRQLHLHDGFARDGGRRRRAACARDRGAQGHRRLGHARGHLDQHQRADDHDRREGRGDDQRRRAAKTGGVARAGWRRRLTKQKELYTCKLS